MSLTYSEVKKQYEALQQTYDYMLSKREAIATFFASKNITSAIFAGCGSSYCLSQSAALSMKIRGGLSATALAGGDLMLNAERYQALFRDAVLVAPSRSGSTSEVIHAANAIRKNQDVPIIAISCVAGSGLSKLSDLALELPWAFDHSVCQTRTVTNLYLANLMLAAFVGQDEALLQDLKQAIALGDAYMERVEASIREAASFEWKSAVLLADGELQGLAGEGAIALTEIANADAHAYHLLDVRHGPMVTVRKDTLVIAVLTKDGNDYQQDLMKDIKARGAKVVAYAAEEKHIPSQYVDLAVVSGQALDVAAQGLPFIFIPQIAALAKAELLGIDPDQPDGLVSWVKL
ncbi:SIS domain-containing protein [Paenibacillus sp. 1001270B_150601_E10]|uniref:SIS domain-containing protein n=1 Tax=Paenibacillus sp. 1001270B_150601_E10 TaxID=2787079 RepID=UPI00189F86F1|nr:SIS domain-containing protein [Paenibacillus sp. 1001270B_150601_E10]